MADVENLKKIAAHQAVEQIKSGMVVGLGTGSTAVHAVSRVGELLANGNLKDIVAIPTSEETAANAQHAGVPLVTLATQPVIDITIDGADEFDPNLDLIKGLGGALLREKVVAHASKRFIVICDERKEVARLGTKTAIPTEVIRFAERAVAIQLEQLGAAVVRRKQADGSPYLTDEGNYILDANFGPLDDARTTAAAILNIPGVVDHGLFLGMADQVIMATSVGIKTFSR